MKSTTGIQAVVIVLFFSIGFFSCESTVAPVSQSVTGKVYSFTKAPLSNLNVTIQNKTATTSSDGSFSINDIVFPYDALIANGTGDIKTLYRNLNTSNTDLMMSLIDRATLAQINVNIPDSIFYKELSIQIIFSDGKNISNYKFIDRQTIPSPISLDLGYSEIPYTGKIYLLTYKIDNQSNIVSYENFGVSEDIVISNGGNLNYTFTKEQVSFNPAELDVPVTITSNGSTNSAFCHYYISFSKEKIYNSQFQKIQTYTSGQFSVKIPADLPVTYYNFLKSFISSTNGGGTEKYLLDPGGQNSFTVSENPVQLTPDDGATVTDETNFTFTPGSGTGIYNIVFYDSTSSTSVFQSQTSIKFSDVKSLIQSNGSSGQLSWYVNKYGTISSIDNFTEEYYRSEQSYLTGSAGRIFNY